MRHHGIAFDEVMIPLDQPDTRQQILRYSPAGKVPVLVEGAVVVWESLAIMDALADSHPDLPIWPKVPAARAFGTLRRCRDACGFPRPACGHADEPGQTFRP